MRVGDSIEDVPRGSPEYKNFVDGVLKRDGNRCKFCYAETGLCVHHLYPYAKVKSLQIDPSNGVTCCFSCHGVIHGRNFKRND